MSSKMSRLDKKTGENLAFLRNAFGFTLDQMANYLDISTAVYGHFETGQTRLAPEALEKLADLFGVEEYDLLYGDKASLAPPRIIRLKEKTDMKAIARFNKIVRNYMLMLGMLNNEKSVNCPKL